jgi:hypothetical protein
MVALGLTCCPLCCCCDVCYVSLSTLYLFAVELAEQCYEAARSVEPTLVPVWEAMAATAATGSAAGAAAAAASAQHAVGLGGGPESWLEHSVGEVQRGST